MRMMARLEMTFISFITGPFDTTVDTASDDDAEWVHCMEHYGLNADLQLAILDPTFS